MPLVNNIERHLKDRFLDINIHKPLLDKDLNIATFYCWNLSGELLGYQQYNPNGDRKIFNSKEGGRYYTYRNKHYPTVIFWGVESLSLNTGPIFLTEGIFDAARMTNRGQSALAAMTNNPPKDYKNWLLCLNRPIVAICDNDTAGKRLAKFGHFSETVPDGKDLGESSEDYVSFLIDKYSKL